MTTLTVVGQWHTDRVRDALRGLGEKIEAYHHAREHLLKVSKPAIQAWHQCGNTEERQRICRQAAGMQEQPTTREETEQDAVYKALYAEAKELEKALRAALLERLEVVRVFP